MKCPVCQETDLTMSSRQNIEIDYCPKCRGVWLDRGELDKLIERSLQETSGQAAAPAPALQQQPAQPQQQQQQHHQRQSYPSNDYDRSHSGYDKRYKKKSFWNEIFD